MTPSKRLVASVFVALIGVFAANALAHSLVHDAQLTDEPVVVRAPNVVVASKSALVVPEKPNGKSVWLLGNSHTYALPGLNRGESLRSDPGVTLIDEVARDIVRADSSRATTTFYRLSNPNLLPGEMLSRVAYLMSKGFQPDVVFVGTTWRNVARDTAIRSEISKVYSDSSFVEDFRRILTEARVPPDSQVWALIEAESRRAAHDASLEKMKSSADHADEAITAAVGRHIALIGESSGLRATIYRVAAYGIASYLIGQKTSELTYDLVPEDFAFNSDCLRALISLLSARGARVVLYMAPERSDLPPMMDPAPQARFYSDLAPFLAEHHALLIDARDAVPNQYWGWEQDTPDRSHFTEPGHKALAARITEQAEKLGAFDALGSR